MSWPLVKLLDCCDISTGKFDANHGVTEGLFPFYTCAEKPIAANTYSFDGDSIILPGNGANVGLVLFYSGKFEAYQRTYVLNSFKKDVYSRYVFHHLSRYWKLRNERSQFGSATNYIRMQNFEDYEIPLPPLEEQKRIAAILDKADAIRRKRQQAIKLADDFLRSVFLEMFGDPVTNPKGWEVKYLKDISRIQIGPFGTQLHKEDYVSDGVPLINPTHISGGKLLPNNDLTVSPQKHAELPEYHLRFGDIIMGRRGEMGRCAVIEKEHVGWLCGTGSLFIRPHNPGVLSEYLFAYLSSDYMKGYLESESLGATMPNLNKGIVGDIKVPLPPQSVMEKYAKIRDQLVCAKQNNIAFSKYNFFESLSQKAFSGDL